jgi:hypothetical protein
MFSSTNMYVPIMPPSLDAIPDNTTRSVLFTSDNRRYVNQTHVKRADTVGQHPNADNCAAHVPALKASKSLESNAVYRTRRSVLLALCRHGGSRLQSGIKFAPYFDACAGRAIPPRSQRRAYASSAGQRGLPAIAASLAFQSVHVL